MLLHIAKTGLTRGGLYILYYLYILIIFFIMIIIVLLWLLRSQYDDVIQACHHRTNCRRYSNAVFKKRRKR